MVSQTNLEPLLTAPLVKPHVSVARMTDWWYVACRSKALKKRKRKAVTILGIPMVLFRTESGKVGALLDRCPHRNVPLSGGVVKGECIQCPYHGWQFATGGDCKTIPGLITDSERKGRGALSYPARDEQGFIWVFCNPDIEPPNEPYKIPYQDDKRYTHARRRTEANGSMHATIENALDVPHTSFLHKGLFRGTGTRNDITAVARRWSERCEAEYIGEPAPKGFAARLLAPGGGEVVHFDRFILPSIAVVDYAIGDKTHFCVTTLCTPVSDWHTKLFAVVSFRLPWMVPRFLVKLALEPIGRKIFSQDQVMLQAQTNQIHRFGGEQFVSTELDVLGPHIWRLMKAAERGAVAPTDEAPFEKTITMNV